VAVVLRLRPLCGNYYSTHTKLGRTSAVYGVETQRTTSDGGAKRWDVVLSTHPQRLSALGSGHVALCPLRYGTTRRQSSRFNCALLLALPPILVCMLHLALWERQAADTERRKLLGCVCNSHTNSPFPLMNRGRPFPHDGTDVNIFPVGCAMTSTEPPAPTVWWRRRLPEGDCS
jgi:hypothetical protein